MLVRNKEGGEIETMRHGPASQAVNAGTHVFVNLDEEGKPIVEKAKGAKKETKAS